MSISKKFITLFTLVIFVLLCAVSYADNQLITEFDITVPDFYAGDSRPTSKNIKTSPSCISFKGIILTNLNNNSNTDTYTVEKVFDTIPRPKAKVLKSVAYLHITFKQFV